MDNDLFSIVFMCSFCLVGVGCLALGFYINIKAKDLIKKCNSKCNGTLIQIGEELNEVKDSDGHYRTRRYFFPIYEFEVQGKKYKIRGTMANSSQEKFEVGEIVEINYNPDNPEESYREGDIFSKVWLIFVIIGIVAIIEGIGVFILVRTLF